MPFETDYGGTTGMNGNWVIDWDTRQKSTLAHLDGGSKTVTATLNTAFVLQMLWDIAV